MGILIFFGLILIVIVAIKLKNVTKVAHERKRIEQANREYAERKQREERDKFKRGLIRSSLFEPLNQIEKQIRKNEQISAEDVIDILSRKKSYKIEVIFEENHPSLEAAAYY